MESELSYNDKMEIPVGEYLVPIGKAAVVEAGTDVTLIAHGRMPTLCRHVVREMAKRGVRVELIDLRTIKPLDIATVAASVRKTHRCVLVEEGHLFSGICAEVAYQVQEHCFDDLDAPVVRVCQRETPMPYSKALEVETMPTVARIVAAIEQLL